MRSIMRLFSFTNAQLRLAQRSTVVARVSRAKSLQPARLPLQMQVRLTQPPLQPFLLLQ
jgi:hypothetical protein